MEVLYASTPSRELINSAHGTPDSDSQLIPTCKSQKSVGGSVGTGVGARVGEGVGRRVGDVRLYGDSRNGRARSINARNCHLQVDVDRI